ncbi:DUF1203 domain-containing protein [Streptomyces sp. NPDC059063]|uniref:DUF1203 domain-containing protein n=1 Tax=unclassified Streptomyces TaxID=2593676 RepID=UPI0036BE2C51
MSTAFTPRPIDPDTLKQLRHTDDAGKPCVPFVEEGEGGSPLRCCLKPARVGERIALVSYAPLRRWAESTGARPGAYDEQGPVFIHADPCDGPDSAPDSYPFDRSGALRTVRRYDSEGRIVGGRLLEIPQNPTVGFDGAFAEAFAEPEVAFVHVRALEYGCFMFAVDRPA